MILFHLSFQPPVLLQRIGLQNEILKEDLSASLQPLETGGEGLTPENRYDVFSKPL
jgi:hypothetical protein